MTGAARPTSLRSVLLRILPLALVLAAAAEAAAVAGLPRLSASDWMYAALLAAHAAAGCVLFVSAVRRGRSGSTRRQFLFWLFRAPEILLAAGLVLFLFSYIYATNANMDYVQRFIASGGNLRLAPDSTRERLAALLRFAPLLALDALLLAVPRLSMRMLARSALGGTSLLRMWALPLGLASGLLMSLSFPSFASSRGVTALAFVCLVPLLAVLTEVRPGWGTFYGVAAGAVQTMVTNYWLGTFNLLTLQFVTVVNAVQYLLFMAAATRLLRRAGPLGFLVFPAGWVLFDWLRSLGFLGYPWGMPGTSLYEITPLIQVSSLTGVWGVSFVVVLVNSAAALAVVQGLRREPLVKAPLVTLAAVLAVVLGWAGVRLARDPSPPAPAGGETARTVRLALVQQNTDPRKNEYESTFAILRRLTEGVLAEKPDLVVWSETAFVPNIRRWSTVDPAEHEFAALVRDFLGWQKSTGTWLVTGNDDYEIIQGPGGEERLDYNAAVLFSPSGERAGTYHKVHLVPFTEYFPYRKQLPAVYRLLQSFDAYLWEPGKERVVFRHPRLSFSTPICFEDAFPNDVRLFARQGAEAIVNMSNDYWSLTEAEAMQHAANAVFRAVENGLPLVRASASGLTCAVDTRGKITSRAPIYEEAVLLVDLQVRPGRPTLYTRWGDWFPPACGFLLLAAGAVGAVLARRRPSRP